MRHKIERNMPSRRVFPLIIALMLLLVGSVPLLSFEPGTCKIKIEGVSANRYVPIHVARSIIQDQRGFLWIGTQDGLKKYDGYTFKEYNDEPFNTGTISGNYILSLFEDREGILWIGTWRGGLNRFDWKTETFTYYKHQPANPASLSHDTVSTIFEDSRKRLWVGTAGGGLNLMERSAGEFSHFRFSSSDNSTIGSDIIMKVFEDGDGDLWVGTVGGGLNRYDARSGGFVRYKHNPQDPTGISHNDVRTIFGDSSGRLWLGTGDGLVLFKKKENLFTRFSVGKKMVVGTIAEDNEGRLWCGTGGLSKEGTGLHIFDPQSSTFFPRSLLDVTPGDLDNTIVWEIFKDSTGCIWLGVMDRGVYRHMPHQSLFLWLMRNKCSTDAVRGNNVFAVCEDREGNLWVGTANGGVSRFNCKNRRFANYVHDPENPTSLYDNTVYAIYEDSDGEIWLGTGGSLDRFDKENEGFIHYATQFDTPDNPGFPLMSTITEDKRGNIWFGTLNRGVEKLDKSSGKLSSFRHVPGNADSLSSNDVSFLYHDREDSLWVGTFSGLNCYNTDTGQFQHFEHVSGDRTGLSSNKITCCVESPPGTLWVGTWGGGLNRMDLESKRFTTFDQKHNLVTNSICSIAVDGNNNLWVSTNRGISKFDTNSETFTNYTEANGLQRGGFNRGAFHNGRSGWIYFGGTNGFNCFLPDTIVANPNIPPVVLTEFNIFGKPITPGGKNHHRFRYITPGLIEIYLSHRENHFSFEFASLDYTNPPGNRYTYMMEGFDKHWIHGGHRRSADYTNLDGGSYVFHVRGSNNDGVWNKKGITIRITIAPPFWKAKWFQTMVLLLLFLCITLPFHIRARRFKVEILHREQSQKVMKRSMRELKKARELMELRHAEVLKLVSAISSILIAIDDRGKIYHWNEPAEAFFNIPRTKIAGKRFVESLSQYIKKENLKDLLETGAKSPTVGEKEVEVHFHDHHRLLSVTISPILDKVGKKRGLLLLCEDISDRRKEESRKNLLLKLQAIGQMHAALAHEINTPIQYLRINIKIISDFFQRLDVFCHKFTGLFKTMEEKNTCKDKKKILRLFDEARLFSSLESSTNAAGMIEEGVNRVTEISKAMKEVFHPGQEQMEMCDINKLLKSTLIVSRYRMREYAEIETHLEENLPLTLCYPARLNQVFLNLISNAVDAVRETGKRGKISIATRCFNDEIIMEFSDTGPGIPMELRDKIFDPFFTTKDVGLGTGQGLSMAKRIIEENHGGKISFESPMDFGTTFYIHLPLTKARSR
ncbi:MAG: PAS domain-containing protein [bacterium]|nr:PAS domain-containing protein [bacterium]